jgi:4-hydroxybenzoate polyprenyltransferase
MNMNTFSLHRPSVRVVIRSWSTFRLTEIVALQGSPVLGFALAIHRPVSQSVRPLVFLLAANLCLVAHIFLTNDWADVKTDLANPNKVNRFFKAEYVSRNDIAGLTIVLLFVSLFLFSRLGSLPLYLAVAIAGASALYSLPPFRWKGRPILSSVLHLIGGTLHFLLGYSVAASIGGPAIATALFFGLTFAAGHLIQELRDFREDARSGVRTNAVSFGPRRTFVASLVLFTFAHALLCFLALRGILPRSIATLIVFYPLQLYWSLTTLAGGLNYASICRLQARYRVIFAIIGIRDARKSLGCKSQCLRSDST